MTHLSATLVHNGGSSTADIWSASATVTAALVAGFTLLSLRKDSRDRTRPMMTAYLRSPRLTHGFEFVLRNAGRTTARDVEVTFSPSIPVYMGTAATSKPISSALQRRYSRPTVNIPPGQTFTNLYRHPQVNDPLPDDFSVTIAYKAEGHRSKYKDTFDLSVHDLTNDSSAGLTGDDYPKRSAKALEEISRLLDLNRS